MTVEIDLTVEQINAELAVDEVNAELLVDPSAERARAEAAEAALAASIDARIVAAVATHTPGVELGAASRESDWSTTAVAPGAAALIPSLVVTVTGKGRPVDIEFFAQTVRHSVADKPVIGYIEVNGSSTNVVAGGSAVVSSPDTALGRTMIIRRRAVLANGVVYTFKAGIYGTDAGTKSLTAAGFAPGHLHVTSRA